MNRIGLVTLLLHAVGCTYGHQERLSYDAMAREAIDVRIIEISTEMQRDIAELETDLPESTAVAFLRTSTAKISELARQDQGRAQVLQLYHGVPVDKATGKRPEIVLGSDPDRMEVLTMAGMAAEMNAKRQAAGQFMERLARNVAQFAATFAAEGTKTVVQTLVPPWVMWVVSVAFVAAVAIGLYALYVRLVIVRRKDRAIDQYDDVVEEGIPDRARRADLADGFELKLEHIVRNERRKQENKQRRFAFAAAIRDLQTSVPRHTAEDNGDFLAPDTAGVTTDNVPPGPSMCRDSAQVKA